MKVGRSVATASVVLGLLVAVGFSASAAEAAPQLWAACGRSSPEDKVVATYSKAQLLCGNDKFGFRHIQNRHGDEWQQLAAIENRNWRDIADMALAKALDNPDRTVNQGRGTSCYSGQIYLVNFATGAIAKTVQPSVIVSNDGRIITAFPGGGCA